MIDLAAPLTVADPALRRLFPGDGDMARLCREFDWRDSPLGAVADWAPELRAVISMMLGVRFSMLVLWGPEHVQLYNDAYRLLTGDRHPRGLGQRNVECWPEFWSVNKPLFDRVLAGEVVTLEDARYPLDRDGSGVARDAYFTISWSPIASGEGIPAGVCVLCIETTEQVRSRWSVAERDRMLAAEREARAMADRARARTERLQALTAALASATSESEVAQAVLREAMSAVHASAGIVLRCDPDDPEVVEIVRSVGFPAPALKPWQRRSLREPSPITDAIRTGAPVATTTKEELAARYPALRAFAASTGFESWVAVPFAEPELAGDVRRPLGGFALAFADPRALDEDEQSLLLALGRQSAQALARARAADQALAARVEAEAARYRAERLRDVVGALSGAPDAAAVYEVLVTEARLVLGAHAGAVALLDADADADADALRFVRWFGYPDGVMSEWIRVPMAVSLPLTDAVRSRTPLWVSSRDDMSARWPGFVEASQAVPSEAWAVLPLTVGERMLGALVLSLPTPRAAEQDLLAFAAALVGHCAQALERARLYDAEREARAEAELANQAKSQFLSTLSHELRNPLHSIGCFAEVLLSGVHGELSSVQVGSLKRLMRANEYMAGLVNTILDFARVEARQVRFQITEVPLPSLLTDVHALAAPQFEAKGVTCRLEIGHGVGDEDALQILADADKTRQILLNLLGNSVKFTAVGGLVTLEADADPEKAEVRLTVRDTGHGVPSAQLERIFDPFVQIDRERTREDQQGVGLGLTISRDLARAMGGDVVVQSEVGVGSAFTLILPLAAAA